MNAVRPCGATAIVVEPRGVRPLAFKAAIEAARRPEIAEVVPAAATVLVVAHEAADVVALGAWLHALDPGADSMPDRRVIDVDVVYDGDDLDEVAAATGLTRAAVVARHAEATYTCDFCGFAPGFGYLSGLDPALVLPRRPSPRTRVPVGSVAIADTYTAVYPTASPGGWHLLGRTAAPLWDASRPEPALITPGTQVRFRPVESLAGQQPFVTPGERDDGAVIVAAPGVATTIQDAGRPGYASLGVSPSGALDPARLALANRLAGNPPTAAGLETAGGLVVEAIRALVIADSASGSVTALRPGDRFGVDPPPGESWAYLAVRGGIAVGPVLGSRSGDTLGGIGPAAPRAGTRLPVGPDPGVPIVVDQAVRSPRAATVHVRLGPRDDWFTPASIESLFTAAWTVTVDRSRVGVRLAGPELQRETAGELPSEGLVTGAIQVPGGGQPIVMLADHPTTGGYPVVGTVEPADLPAVAQAPVGASLRFEPADGERSWRLRRRSQD